MTNNGLLDPVIVSFVFAPLLLTIALLLGLWWGRMRHSLTDWDVPGLLLASAAQAMPAARPDWSAAMLAELAAISSSDLRWRFALSCLRVMLFPPSSEMVLQTAGRNPAFGLLSVALPPLGLPFIYSMALLMEALGGSPLTQTSQVSHPDAAMAVVKIIMLLAIACLLAGVPCGLVSRLRRERARWLSVMGMVSSVCIVTYFLTVMHFLSGGE